jgi:Protein of unknown function (DUF3592)
MHMAIGLVFAAIGALGVTWSAWELVQAVDSKNWSTTDGIVVVSDLQRTRDTDGGYMYRAEVSYRYTVDGTELVSSRPRFGSRVSLSWSRPAVRTTRKYPVGAHVTVLYDPSDPGEAVLEPGVTSLVGSRSPAERSSCFSD